MNQSYHTILNTEQQEIETSNAQLLVRIKHTRRHTSHYRHTLTPARAWRAPARWTCARPPSSRPRAARRCPSGTCSCRPPTCQHILYLTTTTFIALEHQYFRQLLVDYLMVEVLDLWATQLNQLRAYYPRMKRDQFWNFDR